MNKKDQAGSLARTQAARAAFRGALKKAIGDGDIHSAQRVLDQGGGQRGWVTAALVCQAARQSQSEMVIAVGAVCDVKIMQTAAKTLLKKRDVPALIRVANLGHEVVAGDLVNLTAASGDVGMMTQLVRAYDGRSYLPEMLGNAMGRAIVHEKWDMQRYLARKVPQETLTKQARILLQDMIQSASVPLDVLTMALKWPSKDRSVEEIHGELLVQAAQYGRMRHLPLLMSGSSNVGGQVAKQKVAEAIVEALIKSFEPVVVFLIAQVKVKDLRDEFVRQMVNEPQAKQTELRISLDTIGKHLSQSDLVTWVQSFPNEALPRTLALMRERRALTLVIDHTNQNLMRSRPRA